MNKVEMGKISKILVAMVPLLFIAGVVLQSSAFSCVLYESTPEFKKCNSVDMQNMTLASNISFLIAGIITFLLTLNAVMKISKGNF